MATIADDQTPTYDQAEQADQPTVATQSTTITYAHGVAVTYTRGLTDANGRPLWHYRVTTNHGTETEESDYAPTKRECIELATVCRDSLSHRF